MGQSLRSCQACGRPVDDVESDFCSAMCAHSAREVLGPGGSLFFGDADDFVTRRERLDGLASLADAEEHDIAAYFADDQDVDDSEDLDDTEGADDTDAPLITSFSHSESEPGPVVDEDAGSGGWYELEMSPSHRELDSATRDRIATHLATLSGWRAPDVLSQCFAGDEDTVPHRGSFGLFAGIPFATGLSMGGVVDADEPSRLRIADPPYPHPLFDRYECWFGASGLYRLEAFSPDTQISAEGDPARGWFFHLASVLSDKYGPPVVSDRFPDQSLPQSHWSEWFHSTFEELRAEWSSGALLKDYILSVELALESSAKHAVVLSLSYRFFNDRWAFGEQSPEREGEIL